MSDARDAIVERLVAMVVDLSGFEPEEVAPAVPFVELGFDSLFLTQLSQALKQAWGVDVGFRQLVETWPTLEALAGHLAEVAPDAVPADAEPAPAAPDAAPDVRGALAAQVARLEAVGGGAAPGSLREILGRQLDLMSRQLALLQGAARPSQAPAQAASQPTAQQPAPEEPAAAAKPSVKKPSAPAKPTRTEDPRPGVGDDGLTPHQREHLAAFVERYTRRTPGSRARTQQHRDHHADPRTAAGFDRRWKDLVYPLVVERSRGAHLVDVDGHEYVDLLCGFGPIMLGHSPDFVLEAVREQLERGFEIGPQTPLAGETAELLCRLTGMDRASFVCTGSEAVQAALRCARTVTGRTRIATFAGAYHGNFDEVLIRGVGGGGKARTLPAAPGIPRTKVQDVHVLEYGSEASLEAIRAEADDLAAVLVEPVQSRRPDLQPREFLHELRAITERSGTALIFDEVVTGFRCHPGGAQAWFGVEADLATYGKVVAGGLPIGVVAGRRRWMDTFDGGTWGYGDDSAPEAGVTFFAGTFVRHPLAIAAAHAVLTHLEAEGPGLQERLNDKAAGLADRLQALFRELEAPLRLPRFGSVMYLDVEDDRDTAQLLFPHLVLNGVHVQRGFPSYLTTAHTEEDLDRVVDAFRAAIEAMQEAEFLPRPRGVRRPAPLPKAPRVPTEPPVPGARLGRDPQGNPAWFVPDPSRPDGYLRVG